MTELHDTNTQTRADEVVSAPEVVVVETVNWIPTVVALAAFASWEIVSFAMRLWLPEWIDVTRTIEYVLLACVILTALPALGEQFGQRLPGSVRRPLIGVVCFVLLVPVGFGLMWAAYDSLTPMTPRVSGSLPDFGKLMGRSEHDVERQLGEHAVLLKSSFQADNDAPASSPQHTSATRYVVYGLPDINTIAQRAEKVASRRTEAAKLGPGLDVSTWSSDAIVVVYFGKDDRAVGVRCDVSMREATKLVSSFSAARVLDAMGVQPSAAPIIGQPTPAAESSSAASFEASAASSGDSSASADASPSVATTAAPSETPQPGNPETAKGTAEAGGRAVNYVLQLGGLANFVAARDKPTASGSSADAGDVTLTVGERQIGSAEAASGSSSSSAWSNTIAQSSDLEDPIYVGSDAYVDRPMYVVVCSAHYDTEEAALREAWRLNNDAGKVRFTVERSGHLTGLGFDDFFVVIYDIAYVEKSAAEHMVSSNAASLPMSQVSIVQVTKVCGEDTIAKLVE